jgi:hypothetical protein
MLETMQTRTRPPIGLLRALLTLVGLCAATTLITGTALAAPATSHLKSLESFGVNVQSTLRASVLDETTPAEDLGSLLRLTAAPSTLVLVPGVDPESLSAALPDGSVQIADWVAPSWQKQIISFVWYDRAGKPSVGFLSSNEKKPTKSQLEEVVTNLNRDLPRLSNPIYSAVGPTEAGELTTAAGAGDYHYATPVGPFYYGLQPYGKLGISMSAACWWNDGSTTYDFWYGKTTTVFQPGCLIYAGSKWRTYQSLDKWSGNMGGRVIRNTSPNSTPSGGSVTVGVSGDGMPSVSWTYPLRYVR